MNLVDQRASPPIVFEDQSKGSMKQDTILLKNDTVSFNNLPRVPDSSETTKNSNPDGGSNQ